MKVRVHCKMLLSILVQDICVEIEMESIQNATPTMSYEKEMWSVQEQRVLKEKCKNGS